MFWALLAVLGVPIWLIVGVLIAAVVHRRRFQRSPGVFPLRMRAPAGGDGDWSRRLHGRWVHDVLLTNGGLALVLTVPHGTRGLVRDADQNLSAAKGLGADVRGFVLELDDHTAVDVAYPAHDAHTAIGPYDPEDSR